MSKFEEIKKYLLGSKTARRSAGAAALASIMLAAGGCTPSDQEVSIPTEISAELSTEQNYSGSTSLTSGDVSMEESYTTSEESNIENSDVSNEISDETSQEESHSSTSSEGSTSDEVSSEVSGDITEEPKEPTEEGLYIKSCIENLSKYIVALDINASSLQDVENFMYGYSLDSVSLFCSNGIPDIYHINVDNMDMDCYALSVLWKNDEGMEILTNLVFNKNSRAFKNLYTSYGLTQDNLGEFKLTANEIESLDDVRSIDFEFVLQNSA